MPKPIRNPEPMQFIAEPQTIANLIDVSIDDSNYIFSTLSESELTAKESTSFILHLNTFENQSTLPSLLTPLCNGSKIVSTRGWSGALPNEIQSFPTLRASTINGFVL